MNDNSDALRLAKALEIRHGVDSFQGDAAAELRRLQAEHEEDQGVIAVWRGRTLRAEAQRDALLEAIKELIAAERSEGKATGGFIPQAATREHQRRVLLAWQAVHDAIKAAEENQ